MIKKYKYYLLLFALLFLFLSQATLALEVNYPNIPGAPVITADTTLSEYVQYFFIFLILSAGAIGIIAIVVSGFQILMSFGSPAARGAANERIRNTLLGIILLMSSFIIIRTINPEFINPRTTFAGLQPGVYLRNPHTKDDNHPDSFAYRGALDSLADTSKEPSGTELYYYCGATTNKPDLLVWTYNQPGFVFDNNEATQRVKCNTPLKITSPILSFRRNYEDAGVYFYETDDCTGYSSNVQKSSGPIFYDKKSKIKSMKIISGLSKDERYGVILGKAGTDITDGECSEPRINFQPGSTCYHDGTMGDFFPKSLDGKDFEPFYAYIIKYNQDYIDYGYSSGKVQIYSNNLFARLDQQDSVLVGPSGSFYEIGGEFIYNVDPADGNPDQLIREQYIWDNMIYTSGPYKDECCTKEDPDLDCENEDPNGTCLKGLEINGSYYVFLYSRGTAGIMCQDFFSNWDDIPNQTNLLSKNKKLYKIVIIPRR